MSTNSSNFKKKFVGLKNRADSEEIKIAEDKRQFFGRKYRSVYGDHLACLCALLIMGTWRWGIRALIICGVSVLVCVFTDWLCCRMTEKTYNPKDLSTVVAGMCLGLMLPATVGYRYVVFGAAAAMGIKHIFGGKNNYIFNPACLSYVFLAVCWPSQILMFPQIGENIPVFEAYTGPLTSGLESYLVHMGTIRTLSFSDVILGNFVGPIGTTHVLVLLICGICLMFRRALSPTITLVTFGSFLAFSFLFSSYENLENTLVIELVCGNILFGTIFLASDPQTVPRSPLGKVYYGIVIGILLVIFRLLTQTESSFVYVLLIANAVSLHIDLFADRTIVVVKNTLRWLRNNSGSFERVRKEAQLGEKKSLGDTQEIIVPLMNYNMPAVDNKIIKAPKKSPKIVKRENETAAKKGNKENFLTSLRNSMRTKSTGNEAKMKGAEEKTSVQSYHIKQPKGKE